MAYLFPDYLLNSLDPDLLETVYEYCDLVFYNLVNSGLPAGDVMVAKEGENLIIFANPKLGDGFEYQGKHYDLPRFNFTLLYFDEPYTKTPNFWTDSGKYIWSPPESTTLRLPKPVLLPILRPDLCYILNMAGEVMWRND